MLQTLKEQLEDTGFVFSKIEKELVEISGVPAGISEQIVEEIIDQLISDIETEVPEVGYSQNDVMAKSLAKSMAIKSGVSMSLEEQEHLIHQLFACKEPNVSPTNKQTFMTLGVQDFDKKFM